MLRKVVRFLVCILFFQITAQAYPQQMGDKPPRNDWFLEPTFRAGALLPNGKLFAGTSMHGFDLRFGKQTFGRDLWTQRRNYPNYGVALRYDHYSEPAIGDQVALLGYVNGSYFRTKWFALTFQFGCGIAYFTKHYDYQENPENSYIGSHVNAHIDLELGTEFRLNRFLDLAVRGGLSHTSNGASKLPNYGVNTLTGHVGLRCHLQPRPDYLRTLDTAAKFKRTHNLYFFVAPAFRQSKKDRIYYTDEELAAGANMYANMLTYFAGTAQLGYSWHFHPNYRFGAGFDFMYSSELRRHLEDEAPAEWKFFSVATFASIEFVFNRFVVHGAFAVYLYQHQKYYEYFYERAGFKFLLGKQKNHFVGIGIKAHAGMADYLEWQYGWNFQL